MAAVPLGSPGEYTESRARGSAFTWAVAREYRLDGALLKPCDGQGGLLRADAILWNGADHTAATYMPMARPELPAEFAKVADGRDDTLLAFVRRYGLLGQAWTGGRARYGVAEADTIEPDAPAAAHGDSVGWIRAHARTVAVALDLAFALRQTGEVRRARLAKALDAVTGLGVYFPGGDIRNPVQRPHVTFTMGAEAETRELRHLRLTEQHPMLAKYESPDHHTALNVLAICLNSNLGITRREVFAEDGELRVHFNPSSLIGAIYWLLSETVAGGSLRECASPRCGRFFVATDERMRFCPPPMGVKGVSPCMNRDKVRRAREAQRTSATKGKEQTPKGRRRK